MDITKTYKYYDPLYDVITIKPREVSKLIGRRGWHSAILGHADRLLENYVIKILETFEMSRLNFLKQSGLAFLVFPSSTHTRFAHSLGTYYLGETALNRSWIEIGSQIFPLKRWVEDKGLKDEFLLSLLLHDIGHFPFSHIIENNSYFYDDTQNLMLSHEDISCQLIIGGAKSCLADYKDYLRRQGLSDIDDNMFIFKKFEDISSDPFKGTHAGIICWLINGNDENYNEYIPDEKILTSEEYRKSIKKSDLELLKKLTSGLLDLDRMDHYRRDSYFMGVKLAQFNVLSLLDDIILTEDGIKLKADGVSHALSLLHSKEVMVNDIFENSSNLAYEAMLNYCITEYFEQLEDSNKKEFETLKKQFIFWTDDELLAELARSADPKIKKILFRIKNRRPYKLIHKFDRRHQRLKDRKSLDKLRRDLLRKFKRELKDDDSLLLLRIPKGYGPKIEMKEEWFDLNQLMDEKGCFLGRAEYNRDVDYFVLKQNEGIHKFWVFLGIDDPNIKRKIVNEITKRTEG